MMERTTADLDAEIDEVVRGHLRAVLGSDITVELTDDTSFIEDLLLDSLDFIALLAEVEAHWKLSIPDEDLVVSRFATVGALRGYVRDALAGAR